MAAATLTFLPCFSLLGALVGLSVLGACSVVSGVFASGVVVLTPAALLLRPLAKSSWVFFCSSTVVPASGVSLPLASFFAALAPLAPALTSVINEVSDLASSANPLPASRLRSTVAETLSTAIVAPSEAPTATSPCAWPVALVETVLVWSAVLE